MVWNVAQVHDSLSRAPVVNYIEQPAWEWKSVSRTVLFNLWAMVLQWATEDFALGHRAFWLKSYFEKVELEFLLAGDHLFSAGKTAWILCEDLFFFGYHLFLAGKTAWILLKTFFLEIICFRLEKPLEFWCEDLFFLEITCFWPEKLFQCTLKLIWPEYLGQVLKQYFENGPWKICKIKMGHG